MSRATQELQIQGIGNIGTNCFDKTLTIELGLIQWIYMHQWHNWEPSTTQIISWICHSMDSYTSMTQMLAHTIDYVYTSNIKPKGQHWVSRHVSTIIETMRSRWQCMCMEIACYVHKLPKKSTMQLVLLLSHFVVATKLKHHVPSPPLIVYAMTTRFTIVVGWGV